MATRAQKTTAKKTATTTPKPEKKAAAKRTTAARTPRKRAPRRTPVPALTLVKPTDTATDNATVVNPMPKLAVRRRLFVGPMGPSEQAAIRAALDCARTGLPIPVSSWNGSTANLADGLILTHNPGPDRTFTAQVACRHGAIHGYPIRTLADFREARGLTRACETPYAEHTHADDGTDLDWDRAITKGVGPVAQPKTPAVFQLREGVRRANASAGETQPMPAKDIADGLAARAAETGKEHPEP